MPLTKLKKYQLEILCTSIPSRWRNPRYVHALIGKIGTHQYHESLLAFQCDCTSEEFYDYKVRAIQNHIPSLVTINDLEKYYQIWGNTNELVTNEMA